MNEELTLRWINEIVGTFAFSNGMGFLQGANDMGRLHLAMAWDSYKAQMTEDEKTRLKGSNTESVIIPGGCTKYIQAPDMKGYMMNG